MIKSLRIYYLYHRINYELYEYLILYYNLLFFNNMLYRMVFVQIILGIISPNFIDNKKGLVNFLPNLFVDLIIVLINI